MTKLNENIKILGKHTHSKASEEYIDVIFSIFGRELDWMDTSCL